MVEDAQAATQAAEALPPHIQALLEKLARPARDVRQLQPEERRLAVAVLLAALVPADKRVREVELARLNALASQQYKVSGLSLQHIETLAKAKTFSLAEIKSFAAHVPEILNMEDRCALVGLLWEIALCDRELHVLEEEAIYVIADRMEVPRKRTIEQQARAAQRV